MSNSKRASSSEEVNAVAITAEKRVILSMGGKGGVGKTSVMAGLAEWFDANQIPVKLLDLDTENKARGSLTHFFGGERAQGEHPYAGRTRFLRRSACRWSTGDSRRHGSRSRPSHLRLVREDVSRCVGGRNRLHRDWRCDRRSGERGKRARLGGAASESCRIPDRRKQRHGACRLHLLARERSGPAVPKGLSALPSFTWTTVCPSSKTPRAIMASRWAT